jgi:hypothetical protein
MSEKIVKAWNKLGVLNTNSNRVLLDSQGARELLGVGDLSADGSVELLPGYSKILSEPMLADYTTGTVTVSNGSKSVTGSGTYWQLGNNTELVTTGDFSSATGWTMASGTFVDGTGWDIGSGVATRISTAGSAGFVQTTVVPTIGKRYLITYTITRTAVSVVISCGGHSRSHDASGTYTYSFVASTVDNLWIVATGDFRGTVDNISVKEITLNAFRGDLFIGPDGRYYEIADVTGDGAITLTTDYEGADEAGAAYTLRHKVWMLAPFKSQVPNNSVARTQSYASTTAGAFTGTSSSPVGVYVTPTRHVACSSSAYYGSVVTSSSSYQRFSTRFIPGMTLTNVDGVTARVGGSGSDTYSVDVCDDAAGKPGTTVLATSGTITSSTQSAKTTESEFYFPFTSAATFSSGTAYHIVVRGISVTSSVNARIGVGPSTTNCTIGTSYSYNGSAWGTSVFPGYNLNFGFIKYPTTAKTYVAPVIDLGATPTSATLTVGIRQKYKNYYADVSGFTTPLNFATSDSNTVTWELNTSALPDMSTPTQVATGQSVVSYSISGAANLKRYYQLTYTLTSITGESAAAATDAAISAVVSALPPTDLNLAEMVGCGTNVYTSISSSASTINTTNQTSVRPAAWCTYNNTFFYRNGATLLRRWDGINTADGAVADMLKTDAVTAGADPPHRSNIVLSHNDKLLSGGYLGIQYFSAASSALSETALTGTGYTANLMVGWKLRANISWFPEQWSIITGNSTTVATCTGSELITKGHGALGDTYSIMKFYPKQVWYSTEAEPADWPTANFLNFNTADGDLVQQMLSHQGNLLVVCSEQVWLVRGYGPSTPWSKTLLCKSGGTVAPMSVVSTAQDVYWWSEEGIVRCAGGTGIPEVIDTEIRDLTLGAINHEMRHNIIGALHQGRIYWSYPSTGSSVNDKTIILEPSTRMWALYDFGMYCPVSILELTGDTFLKFWDPTTGCICKINPDVYTYDGSPVEFVHTTSFSAVSNPVEMAQYLYLRVVAKAGETFTGTVSAAYDYGDTYTQVGELVPVDSAVTGRTSLNATDTIYVCRFGTVVRGTAISVKVTGTTSTAFKIMQIEIVADPVEYSTLR